MTPPGQAARPRRGARRGGRRLFRSWLGGPWLGTTLALVPVAAIAAALSGCANPNFIPAGSRPIQSVTAYPQPALAQGLAGKWRVLRHQQPPQTAYAANLLQRAAEVQNVNGWTAMSFLPPSQPLSEEHPGALVVANGARSVHLVYWLEGNLVAIASSENRTMAHGHWQAVIGPKTLWLRSLEDGEVITLARAPSSG